MENTQENSNKCSSFPSAGFTGNAPLLEFLIVNILVHFLEENNKWIVIAEKSDPAHHFGHDLSYHDGFN